MEKTSRTNTGFVVRSSVFCKECDEQIEAQPSERVRCSCGKSWVMGHTVLKGHNTSIMADRRGQLRWEF